MRHPRLIAGACPVAIAATIGGPASQTTVQTVTTTVQGETETILVDAQGLPLYIYKPDTATTSHVSRHVTGQGVQNFVVATPR